MGKHRLPSGFGSIRNLGAGRTRPYAVHPPAVKVEVCGENSDAGPAGEGIGHGEQKTENVIWKRPAAICYVSSWESGLKILVLYHAGFYKDGMENMIESGDPVPLKDSREILCKYCIRVMADIEKIKNGERSDTVSKITDTIVGGRAAAAEEGGHPTITPDAGSSTAAADTRQSPAAFWKIYQSFYKYKYGEHAQKQLSKSTRNATNAACKRFSAFYSMPLDKITVDDLQNLVNEAADEGCSKSTVRRMVTLAHQLWKYAYPRGLCTKESGKYVEMPKTKEETHHQDFTDEELAKLWKVYRETADPVIRMILIMCYSGYRVGEYEAENFKVFDGYFRGGFKTDAGRNRIVPIHSAICSLVEEIKVNSAGNDADGMETPSQNKVSFFCEGGSGRFRKDMKEKMAEIGIDGRIVNGIMRVHTPHSCRHTFSRLCESYGVNEADRKRMMGHSFKGDITSGVYGHRSVAELKEQIERIKISYPLGEASEYTQEK